MQSQQELQEMQLAFAAAIRDPDLDTHFPNVSPEQLAVYRELFWDNVKALLDSACPVAREVLGQDTWSMLLGRFWKEHPASTPEYTRMPFEFADWIAGQNLEDGGLPLWLAELIRWEVAELGAMFAPESNDTRPRIGYQRHSIAPSLQLHASLGRASHRQELATQHPGDHLPACYRTAELDIAFMELTPLGAALLELLLAEPEAGLAGATQKLADAMGPMQLPWRLPWRRLSTTCTSAEYWATPIEGRNGTQPSNRHIGEPVMTWLLKLQSLLDSTRRIDFLAPLALRLYLAPVFWMAGSNKLGDIESTAAWFGTGLRPEPACPPADGLAGLAHRSRWCHLAAAGSGSTLHCPAPDVHHDRRGHHRHWHNGWLAIAEGPAACLPPNAPSPLPNAWIGPSPSFRSTATTVG